MNEKGEKTYPLPLDEIRSDYRRLLPNGVRPYYKLDDDGTKEGSEGRYVVPLLPPVREGGRARSRREKR